MQLRPFLVANSDRLLQPCRLVQLKQDSPTKPGVGVANKPPIGVKGVELEIRP